MKNLESKFIFLFFIVFVPFLFIEPQGKLPEFGKGVGMTTVHCEDIWNLNVGVYYTWGHIQPECGRNFIPMIWGKSFTGTIEPTNLNVLLFLNEPNAYSQANVSPEEAAIKFKQLNLYNWFVIGGNLLPQQFNPSDANMNEHEWLGKFIDACQGCLDGIGIHYYDWFGCESENFINYLESFENYNLPIYVTEMACLDPDNVMVGNIGLWGICFEKAFGCFPFATRIPDNWVAFEPAELIDESGNLTLLGQSYQILNFDRCWCVYLPAVIK